MDRRTALRTTLALLAAGCGLPTEGQDAAGQGRLTRRGSAASTTLAAGTYPLGLAAERDGLLHIPPHEADDALAFVLLLHGAGGSAAGILDRFLAGADSARAIVLAPDARSVTWDVIDGGGFSWDVAFIDRALEYAFTRCRIDPSRRAIAGFSDGGTYALSLGLINGDFFSHVAAFAPGTIAGDRTAGKPRVFITHGTADPVLPIGETSRRIVPWLVDHGYTVAYHEHAGGHVVSVDGVRRMFDWLGS